MQNNNLPDGWKIVKLRDYTTERKQKNKANEELTVFSISNKRGFVKSDDYFEGQVYSKDLKNYKIVKKGDFAYNPARINVGSIAYLESEEIGLLSPMYVIFSLNNEIDKDYFSYFIKGNLFNKQVNNFTQGAVRQILSFGDLGNISLLLPPLEVQKEIAGKLNDLDKLIETQNNQIEKYEKLKKAMMKKLFSEGIGHTEFKDSKLGRIPKEWEVNKLDEISDKIGDGIHKTPEYIENGSIYFINGNNLINNKIIVNENTKTVNEEEYIKYKKELNNNTILLSINGTIGNTAFYNFENVILGKSACYIILKDNINKKFINFLLNYDKTQDYFEFELTGTTIRNLSLKSIRKTLLQIPLIQEQEKIADILENIDNLLEKEREIKEGYEKVKKGIVSLVFSCNLLIK